MHNLLILYNGTQTYTDTVYQHLRALANHSRYEIFFAHHDATSPFNVDLSRFVAIVIHYSVRLPYNEISPAWIEPLSKFSGCKALFIQDEYDHTHRTWEWIRALGINLVFSVVPERNLAQVYPLQQFPSTRFVSVLTGYAPEGLPDSIQLSPPSQRSCLVGYRGRPLPARYGKLGQEKIAVGAIVKQWCKSNNLECDIAWSEKERIYGQDWFSFVSRCRAMLGSESGCNVFDWEGDLDKKIQKYKDQCPNATEADIYHHVIRPNEKDGLMNQISPRVFESIAMRSALVLFEGHYSGILEPDRHFIPLKKDGSNLAEVFAQLQDNDFVDNLAEFAYNDIIGSGNYSYASFAAKVDQELGKELSSATPKMRESYKCDAAHTLITTLPIRARSRDVAIWLLVASRLWKMLPFSVRRAIKSRVAESMQS